MRVTFRHLIGCAMAYGLSAVSLGAISDLRLVDAVKSQDKDAVRTLLKQRVDVNAPQADGATALHWAAHWNDLETADLLISAGANVNAETDLGATPLYLACEIGSPAMAGKLLAAKANPNVAAATGVSPLMLAARAGSAGTVQALLAHGANVNAKEHTNEQTALMWAVAQGHPDVARMLAENGADIHARSRVGSRLVNMGSPADGGDIPAELKQTLKIGGSTALLFAARHGDVESATVLLSAGANVNDAGADGNSALVVAAHSGHGAFAAFLLDKGADANARGAGYTVLHAAVLRGNLELVKASLAHGANPNIPLANGTPVRRSSADFFLPASLVGATPLLLAAQYASVDMMRALVANGADPRLAAKDGTTPLIAAATSDRRRQGVLSANRQAIAPADESQGLEAVKMLLDLGAATDSTNSAGDTALHVAASGQLATIVQLLAEKGAKLEVKNKRGQTPLALASAPSRRGGARAGSQLNTGELLRKLGAKE